MNLKAFLYGSYVVFALSIAALVWFGFCLYYNMPIPRTIVVLTYLWPMAAFSIAIFRKKIMEAGNK